MCELILSECVTTGILAFFKNFASFYVYHKIFSVMFTNNINVNCHGWTGYNKQLNTLCIFSSNMVPHI